MRFIILLSLITALSLSSCTNTSSLNTKLNRKLLSEHQDFIQEHSLIQKEHQDWENEFKSWQKEFKKIKDQSGIAIEHRRSLLTHRKELLEHEGLIQSHQELLDEHSEVTEKHANGRIDDQDFKKAHETISLKQISLLKTHDHIKEIHTFLRDAHESVLHSLKSKP